MKRKLSLLLAIVMILSLVPMSAFAATQNRVATVPTIADDAENTALGWLTLREDSDFASDLITGRTFTVTFPSGVKLANNFTSTVQDFVYYASNGSTTYTAMPGANVVKSGNYTVDVTIPTTTAGVDSIQIRPIVNIDGAEAGEIKVTVDAFDSGITGGTFVLGAVGSSSTTATLVTTVPTIGEVGNGATIRLTENSVGAITDAAQWIELRLPNGFKWDPSMTAGQFTFLAGLSGSSVVSGPTIVNERTLKVQIDPVDSRTQRGIIQIVPKIMAERKASVGEIELEITGDEISSADLVVAKYAEFGVKIALTDDEATEKLTGRFGQKTAYFEITENVNNSIVGNRKTVIEFPKSVKIEKVEVKSVAHVGTGVTATDVQTYLNGLVDGTSNELEFIMPQNASGKSSVEMRFVLSVEADEAGEIKAKISGKQGIEGEILLMNALAPVKVTADTKDIKVGVKDQAIGDITIVESQDEAIDATSGHDQVTLTLPNGIVWADADVEVVSGNAEIDEVDMDDEVLTITFDNSSSKPATIKVTNATVTLDRTIPEGDVKVSVGGNAIVFNNKAALGSPVFAPGAINTIDEGEFDQNSVASVKVARVATPAPGEYKADPVAFKIDAKTYTVGGVEKTADLAPYIKDSRTFLSVRYAAEALGVDSNSIVWDQATQTVTIIKDGKIAQITVGSNVLKVNGMAITMDTSAENVNGRVTLPIAHLAIALGVNYEWNATDRTVTFK